MCSGCHRNRNPEYPNAPTWLFCEDCHAALAEESLIFGNELKLYTDISLAGDTPANSSHVEEFLRENFDLIGFVLCDEKEAELKAKFSFELEEVYDGRLLPPESGVRLFRGKCLVRILHNGKEILYRTIRSKVFADRDANAAREAALDYLRESAFRLSKRVIEPLLE